MKLEPSQRRNLYRIAWVWVATAACLPFGLPLLGWARHVQFFGDDHGGGIDVITPIDPTSAIWVLLGLIAASAGLLVVAEVSRRKQVVLGVWGPVFLISVFATVHASLIHAVWPAFVFVPISALALAYYRPSRVTITP